MATPERVIKDISEIKLLRAALAKAAEYQPGQVRVSINFNQPIQHRAVKEAINKIAMQIIKGILTTNEMRARIAAALSARIAVLEAKYPGLVD